MEAEAEDDLDEDEPAEEALDEGEETEEEEELLELAATCALLVEAAPLPLPLFLIVKDWVTSEVDCPSYSSDATRVYSPAAKEAEGTVIVSLTV